MVINHYQDFLQVHPLDNARVSSFRCIDDSGDFDDVKNIHPLPNHGLDDKDHFANEKKSLSPVERPLKWLCTGLHLRAHRFPWNTENSMMDDWTYLPMRRTWTFGFNISDLSNLFRSIPPTLSTSLETLLRTLQITLQMRTARLKIGSQIEENPSEIGSEQLNSETSMWQEQTACGFVKLFFDSKTQERKHLVLNSTHAKMWGMHAEELEARLANHDLKLFSPPLDFFYNIFDDVLSLHEDTIVRYFRSYSAIGQTSSAVLFRSERKRTFNSSGQMCQVLPLLSYCTL